MSRSPVLAAGAAILLLAGVGCFGGTVKPPASPYLQLSTSRWGSTQFWLNGKEVQSGYWSKDLEKHLTKVPEAREHFDTWRTRQMLSFGLNIASILITAVGLAFIEPGSGFDAQNKFSLGMIIGGSLPVSITSFLVGLSAGSHLHDAVYLYNRSVQRQKAGLRMTPNGFALKW